MAPLNYLSHRGVMIFDVAKDFIGIMPAIRTISLRRVGGDYIDEQSRVRSSRIEKFDRCVDSTTSASVVGVKHQMYRELTVASIKIAGAISEKLHLTIGKAAS
jgi:hypothetical protein